MPALAPVLAELRVALPHVAIREEGREVIALPGSTEEVAAVLRHCDQNHIPIEISGAGTKRTWSGSVEAALTLRTTRISGVREHSWQDLTATVGAGTPWAEMQRVLATHGQMVALDPLWAERATVGGVLAANDSGAWRLKYGSARDLVIGMTLVLADGTIAKTGGKVVKNVAGYDLHKLMIGAFGTLAAITEVTFRLHPLPQHHQSFTICTDQATRFSPIMRLMGSSHLLTQALQVRGDATAFYLDIQLNARADSNQVHTLKEMAEATSVELQPAPKDVWLARETLFAQPEKFVLKAATLPQEVVAFVNEVAEKGGSCVAQSMGILHASFRDDELSGKLAQEFRYHVGLQGGSTVLLTPAAASHAAEWTTSPAQGEQATALPLMREIKRQFDPGRILNRGLMGGV